MGDLSCVMPTIQAYSGGSKGTGHGSDYYLVDPEAACIQSAKWQLGMIRLLLENDAARAKEILAGFTPRFASKEEFFAFQDSLSRDGDCITYLEDGNAEVRLV